MADKVYGFDSRYWDGYITEDTNFKFVGIKISENTNFIPEEPVKQWKRAKRVYGLMRMPFHFWRGPKWYQDPHEHGKAQAQFFYDTLRDGDFGGRYNGMGELPPVLDLEDTTAPIGRKTIQSIKACLNKIEILFGRKPIIYTAGWWFDRFILPHYSPENFGGWDIYSYDLWEADPPPDTPIADGKFGESEIIQYELSVPHSAFNTVIDKNETTQAWIDKVVEEAEKLYTQEQVDALLKEQEENLTSAHHLILIEEKKNSWNDAIHQAGIRVGQLRKD